MKLADNFCISQKTLRKILNMEDLIKKIQEAHDALLKFANELPDLDAHSYTYSIVADAADYLNDRVLRDLPLRMVEAEALAKKNPNLSGKKRF